MKCNSEVIKIAFIHTLYAHDQWRSEGGGGGQLPLGTDPRGAPKCLDVSYK